MKKFWRLPFGLVVARDPGQALITAGALFGTHLVALHLRDGEVLKRYDLGSGVVTNAGVAFMADDWFDATKEITNFNYHDSGTGIVAAAVGDTILGTQAGPVTRATGTKTNPTAPVLRTVGTIAYVSTLAITEWGLFDQAAQGGTLWDRKVFTAINVVTGDSIQFTYDLTFTAGG